ncbi:hypothetical protein RvY_09392 [Ramazzottius varieornatus]|uniref:Uncharacterized protein n=1 Tax=Ramazzottius varieornatus TaxID=947166 RepID=A0A1D1V979_RAMVA|nr:hypothetical protein RvY_09392 [Ramazzottius varieornatus]
MRHSTNQPVDVQQDFIDFMAIFKCHLRTVQPQDHVSDCTLQNTDVPRGPSYLPATTIQSYL